MSATSVRDEAATAQTGRWVLGATIVGSSMVFIDSTVVNVALPVLQSDLKASVTEAQWVVEAYTLFLAALLLVGGSLGDLFGRKRVFGIGTVIFAAASIWCGLAPDATQLILARAVQGIGGSLLVPGSLAIISAAFDNDRRGKAIGTWSGASAIVTALGPVLGGFLIQQASWRYAFVINVPLAIIVLILLVKVPESRAGKEARKLDYRGAVLATVGLAGLVYGLIESSNQGWSAAVVTSLVAGAIAVALFAVVEARVTDPMMPLGLFRSRTFSGANLLTLLVYGALSVAFFFVPFDLIQVQGYSPTAAGAAFLPFILLISGLSRWSGGLVARYGAKLPLTVGPLITGLGYAMFALPGKGGSYWTTYFPAVVVLGLGMAITVAPLTTAVMGAVDQSRAGIASGINNAVSRAAGLVAIAVLGIVMLNSFTSGLDRRLAAANVPPATRTAIQEQRTRLGAIDIPKNVTGADREALKAIIDESFLDGFRLVMLISGGLAAAGGVAGGLLIEGKSREAAPTLD